MKNQSLIGRRELFKKLAGSAGAVAVGAAVPRSAAALPGSVAGGTGSSLTCNPSPSGAAPCPDLTHAPTITPATARNYSIRLTAAAGSTMKNVLVTVQLQ